MIQTVRFALIMLALTLGFASCNSLIHDDLEDCPTGLIVELKPRYASDKVFRSEVNDVHIYVFNEDGNCVREVDLDGAALLGCNFKVSIKMPSGCYRVVAWNGLKDTVNYTTTRDADVHLNFDSNSTNRNLLTPLWHGASDGAVEVEDMSVKTITVPMVKDTNTVTVMVSIGQDAPTADQFSYEIIGYNGALASDNSLTDTDQVVYGHYLSSVKTLEGSLNSAALEELGEIPVAVGELNTSRLTTDRSAYIRIKDTATGEPILTINLIQYILLARSTVTVSNQEGDSDQEYLDTESDFNMTFIMTPSQDGSGGYYRLLKVIVNGWIVRLDNAQLK